MPRGTNTLFYAPKSSVPANRNVTYARMVATIRLHKTKFNRVCVTVGGYIRDYPGATTTNCTSLTNTKCLLNSTISTPDAWFMTLNIKEFYYGTPMARYEYMKLALYLFPEKIIEQYDLRSLVCPNGWIYMEIRKGMPGIKQADRVANDWLKYTSPNLDMRLSPALLTSGSMRLLASPPPLLSTTLASNISVKKMLIA